MKNIQLISVSFWLFSIKKFHFKLPLERQNNYKIQNLDISDLATAKVEKVNIAVIHTEIS